MSTQLIAKLIELAYSETQSDLDEHEIEDRLIGNLLGKSLDFTTEQGDEGTIRFQSLGRGKRNPSTVVNLQVEGVEFEQKTPRLTLDLRYVFYQTYGHDFLFIGTSTEFLVSSPTIQKLGPSNILIEFVVYGDTVYQVNRCLAIFAEVIRKHQDDLHQAAIDEYESSNPNWEDEPNISLEELIRDISTIEDPLKHISATANEESYIEDYIKYVDDLDDGFREVIDNRNTYARSEFE